MYLAFYLYEQTLIAIGTVDHPLGSQDLGFAPRSEHLLACHAVADKNCRLRRAQRPECSPIVFPPFSNSGRSKTKRPLSSWVPVSIEPLENGIQLYSPLSTSANLICRFTQTSFTLAHIHIHDHLHKTVFSLWCEGNHLAQILQSQFFHNNSSNRICLPSYITDFLIAGTQVILLIALRIGCPALVHDTLWFRREIIRITG